MPPSPIWPTSSSDTSTTNRRTRSRSRLRTTPRCRVETNPWPSRHPGREVSSPSCRRPRSSAPVRSPPRSSCRQPLAGLRRRLPYGRATLGSAPTCAVVVGAAGVEPIHAEVVVGDSVELHAVGTGSIDVDGTPVRGGIRLGSGSLISIGSELLTLRIDQPLRPPPARGPLRAVARVPSMRPEPNAEPIEVPVPPERTRLPGFPVLSATVPLLMGAALWIATRSVLTAAFVLFSFVFVVAGGLESRRESRAEQRFRVAEFRRLLAEAADRANDRAERCVAGLDATSPRPAELLAWAGRPEPRLWERWDVGPAVMRVRLGHREQLRRAVSNVARVDSPISRPTPTASWPRPVAASRR